MNDKNKSVNKKSDKQKPLEILKFKSNTQKDTDEKHLAAEKIDRQPQIEKNSKLASSNKQQNKQGTVSQAVSDKLKATKKAWSKKFKRTKIISESKILDSQGDDSMILDNIKRIKLFFVSDMDDEAKYLHAMSLQGFHFITKKGIYHIFRQGEPLNYYYHLSYYEKDKRDGERTIDNYENAGWEIIYYEKAEFDGIWNYFRIEMAPGEAEPNIFSDKVSRISLYKRLLSSWRTLLTMDIICLFFMVIMYRFLSNHPSNLTGIFMIFSTIITIIIVFVLIVYAKAYIKISRKLEELNNI